MIDPWACPSCSFANPPGAESCVKCGTALAETPERVHPGETLRDPDDLTLPPSPLLRAVLRGEPAVAAVPSPRPAPAPTATTPTPTPIVAALPPTPTVTAPPPAPTVTAPQPAPTVTVPPPATPRPPARASVEHLSPSADQAALLRDLAERLHAGKAPAEVRYAGFFVRVAAFLVDAGVLGAFGVPLAAAGYFGLRAGMLVVGETSSIEPDETLLTILTVAWFTMATVYFTVLHRTYGQTIGKSLLRLRVQTLALGDVGYGRALIRTLGYAVSSSFLGFGFLLVAVTPRKRGWHDFLAGTCVVRLAAEEASS